MMNCSPQHHTHNCTVYSRVPPKVVVHFVVGKIRFLFGILAVPREREQFAALKKRAVSPLDCSISLHFNLHKLKSLNTLA